MLVILIKRELSYLILEFIIISYLNEFNNDFNNEFRKVKGPYNTIANHCYNIIYN